MVDSVFSFGELGFPEFETSVPDRHPGRRDSGSNMALTSYSIYRNLGTGQTCHRMAPISTTSRRLQKPGVAYRDPMIEGSGQRGHNSGCHSTSAAHGSEEVMEREHLSGTIKLWPEVAEELHSNKAYTSARGFRVTLMLCSLLMSPTTSVRR
jgi:aminobenzoyl-glutamate utilization protein B